MIGQTRGRRLPDAVRQILRSEGPRKGGILSFWRGITPALLRIVPHASIFFYSTHRISRLAKEQNWGIRGIGRHFIVGGTARSLAVIATCPLLVVKTRMEYQYQCGLQSGGPGSTGRIRGVLSDLLRENGVRGLFRGLQSSLVRSAPFGALFFGLYRSILDWENNSQLCRSWNPSLKVFCASAFASVTAHYALHPFDVVRTRIQLQDSPGASSMTIGGTIREIHRNEGLWGVWRGTLPKVARKGLASAVGWTVYSVLLRSD